MAAHYPPVQDKPPTNILNKPTMKDRYIEDFKSDLKNKSDRLMDYFLPSFFIIGLLFAFYYDTWMIAIGVGGLSLIAYYSAKYFLPSSNLYQYVLSLSLIHISEPTRQAEI